MIGVAASSTGSSTLQIIATSVTALGVILAFGGLMHTIKAETTSRQIDQDRALQVRKDADDAALRAREDADRRDRAARLAEVRTSFLHGAYLTLSEAISQGITRENHLRISLALKDIQLLGDPKQVKLADDAVTESRGHPGGPARPVARQPAQRFAHRARDEASPSLDTRVVGEVFTTTTRRPGAREAWWLTTVAATPA
jgi:hypothetical protein